MPKIILLFILFSGILCNGIYAQEIELKKTDFTLTRTSNKALRLGKIELNKKQSDYRFVLIESSYPDVIQIDFSSGEVNLLNSTKLKAAGIDHVNFKVLINDQKRALSLVKEFNVSLKSNLKSIKIIGSPENDFDVYISDQINHGKKYEDQTRKNDICLGAWAWTSQGKFFEVYCLLKIDLSPIRKGVKISHVVLNLKGVNHKSTVENAVYVQKITEDWDINTVTWNNQPESSEENRIKLELTNDKTKDYTIDVTSFVKQWIKSPSKNQGLMFKMHKQINYARLNFGSCNHPDVNKRPSLIIYYE